jgi:hypothetical protein
VKDIGRPTEDELDRMEELVNELFVGDSWGLAATFWDDRDVHLRAYSTLGSNVYEGYPMYVISHKQEIIYERQDDEAVYRNRVEMEHPRQNKILQQRDIEW